MVQVGGKTVGCDPALETLEFANKV
ncbi:MAG: hypothetical protein ACFUZC_12420 [Chthoniobacteraceae bacterium]